MDESYNDATLQPPQVMSITPSIVNVKIDQATDDLDSGGTKWTFVQASSFTLLLWRPAGEYVNFPLGWYLNGSDDATQTKTRLSDGKKYLLLNDKYQVSLNPISITRIHKKKPPKQKKSKKKKPAPVRKGKPKKQHKKKSKRKSGRR